MRVKLEGEIWPLLSLAVGTVWLKMFATRIFTPWIRTLSLCLLITQVLWIGFSRGTDNTPTWCHMKNKLVCSATTTWWAVSLSPTRREGSQHPAACSDGHGEGQLHGLWRICGRVWECHWEMSSDCSCCLVPAPVLWLGRFRKALFRLYRCAATVRWGFLDWGVLHKGFQLCLAKHG